MSKVFFKKITYDELLKQPDILVDGIKISRISEDFKKGDFTGIKRQ
jgi:hypothetical protein